MPNKRACSLRRHTPRGYTPHETTSPILLISPSQSKNLLALVKIQILKPSGWVIPKQLLHLCPYSFMFVSTQTWRNISKMCLLDSSRSRRGWGFSNFHDLWAAPGAKNQTKSNQIKPNQTKSNQVKSNQTKSIQIKPNQTKYNQSKANQIISNQIKSNQINSN